MRAKEFITESKFTTLNQFNDGGSLEGYVVDTDKPNLTNYLESQGANAKLISAIVIKYKKIGIVRNMYVDPDLRGKGYGNSLLGDAIDEAAEQGAEAIVLVADMHEDNAINLVHWYESFGFEVIGDAHGDPIMILDMRANE